MIFHFEKPVNPKEYGLPREIQNSRDDWFIFKTELSYKPFFPRAQFTSLGYGWWFVNETGDYLYCRNDNTLYLYSVQKDTQIEVSNIYRFKEDGRQTGN